MTKPDHDEPYRERLRMRLIEAAQSVMITDGFSAVQARRIAGDGACSVGTLYNIFGDIDGLILAVNERTLDELGHSLEAATSTGASHDLKTRLMALATAYLDFATAHPRRWRAVFEHRLPQGTQVPAFYVADRQRLLSLIETQIAGAIPGAASRSIAAHALFSAVHGIVMLSLDEKLGDFDPVQCQRQIRFIVENVARGLR